MVPGKPGTIAHVELIYGNGMIMLGSLRNNDLGRLLTQPDEVGGCETQSTYVIVADADTHYSQAKLLVLSNRSPQKF